MRDVFITDLSRLSLIPVETVKVVWIAIDVSSVSAPLWDYPCAASRQMLELTQPAEARSELQLADNYPRRPLAVRY